ncbi:MAG: hypothetical protein AAFU33_25925 [Bacteroidota bacterium]
MKKPLLYVVLSMLMSAGVYGQTDTVYTQDYLDESTRFAWLTYGGDFNYLSGGTTQQMINGTKQTTDWDIRLTKTGTENQSSLLSQFTHGE